MHLHSWLGSSAQQYSSAGRPLGVTASQPQRCCRTGSEGSLLWGAVLTHWVLSTIPGPCPLPDLSPIVTTRNVFRRCSKSPWRQNRPQAENHCFFFFPRTLTSHRPSALPGNPAARPRFHCPSVLLDDSFVLSFASSNLQFLPAPSLAAGDLHGEMGAIRILSGSPIKHLCPQSLRVLLLMVLHLCASLSRTSLQQHSRPGTLVPSPLSTASFSSAKHAVISPTGKQTKTSRSQSLLELLPFP